MSVLLVGWLSPEGKLYSCRGYEHISKARELVKQYRYPPESMNFRLLSDDEILLKHGWVHIGRSSGTLGRLPEWIISWHPRLYLTQLQKDYLRPYFANDERVNIFCKSRWEEETQ